MVLVEYESNERVYFLVGFCVVRRLFAYEVGFIYSLKKIGDKVF